MSLIQCPNCGQSISDKAVVCPHCNYRNANISTDKVTCQECGEDYDNTQSFCPSCGCPNNKTTPKKKKHIGMIITLIISKHLGFNHMLILTFFLLSYHHIVISPILWGKALGITCS